MNLHLGQIVHLRRGLCQAAFVVRAGSPAEAIVWPVYSAGLPAVDPGQREFVYPYECHRPEECPDDLSREELRP